MTSGLLTLKLLVGAITVQIEDVASHNAEIKKTAKIQKGIITITTTAATIEGVIENAEIAEDLDILEAKLKRMKMERVCMRLILMNLRTKMNLQREILSIKTEMIQDSNLKLVNNLNKRLTYQWLIKNNKVRKWKTERKKMNQKKVRPSLRHLFNNKPGRRLKNQLNKKTHGDRLEKKCACI